MSGGKILIIDDNPMNLELASDLLELHGFLVLKAEDSKTGIELAKKENPEPDPYGYSIAGNRRN